jgi:xylulokinase
MAYLGIDLGTSAVKALLINDDGALLASASVEYPLLTPQPLWTEQNADEWWRATAQAIRAVLQKSGLAGNAVRAIGLSGQMHGLTLMDARGEVLRPAILWNDQRTAPQVQRMIETVGAENIPATLTNRPNPSYTAPKLLWVRENEPEIYKQARCVLLPKDFVRFKLSGVYAGEVTDATGVALFNVPNRAYSSAVLQRFDIDPALFPVTTESHVVSANVSQQGAEETGLAAGTPIVGGAGDVAAAGLGAGAVREGTVMCIIGTSGVMFASIDAFKLPPPGLETFCHAVPDKWHYMSVMLSGGGSLRWHRDTLAFGDPCVVQRRADQNGDPYEAMIAAAAQTPPGADGLIFAPYLTGERTPHQNPKARAAFVGMTLSHTQAHFTRAVIEGVAYGLKDSLQLMRNAGLNVREVRLTGGAAKSAFWRQTLADVFDATISTLNITEGGAFGVALLAGVAVGRWRDIVEACDAVLSAQSSTTPNPANRALYDDGYEVFKTLYPGLSATYR